MKNPFKQVTKKIQSQKDDKNPENIERENFIQK
jgi:hypothetical protein